MPFYTKEGHYYISFQDGQGVLQEFEITQTLYEAFDEFELSDIGGINSLSLVSHKILKK